MSTRQKDAQPTPQTHPAPNRRNILMSGGSLLALGAKATRLCHRSVRQEPSR